MGYRKTKTRNRQLAQARGVDPSEVQTGPYGRRSRRFISSTPIQTKWANAGGTHTVSWTGKAKKPFGSREEAERFILETQVPQGNTTLQAYRCRECPAWHIGTPGRRMINPSPETVEIRDMVEVAEFEMGTRVCQQFLWENLGSQEKRMNALKKKFEAISRKSGRTVTPVC